MPYKDPEKAREYGTRRYIKNREDMLAKRAAHYAANKARVLAQQNAYRVARYAENPEKVRAEKAAWISTARAKNPEKYREQRRARCAKSPGTRRAEDAERRAREVYQRCGCCTRIQIKELYDQASLVGGEVDHRIPLALGGHHCTKNLQSLTHENHRKKTKTDNTNIAAAKRVSKLLLQWRFTLPSTEASAAHR